MTSPPDKPHNISVPQTISTPPVKDIHVEADELVKSITQEFENDLRVLANTLARADELVLKRHVDEALRILRVESVKSPVKEFSVLIGGTLLGIFGSTAVNELSMASPRGPWLALYVILIVLAFGFILYGFDAWKRYKP